MIPVTLILPCKGSDCDHALALMAQARKLGLRTYLVPNKRYGEAIKTGLQRARTPYVATMDTDGQHALEDLLPLWHTLEASQAAMVIGARRRTWNARGLTSCALNLAMSILVGQRVPDFGSGLRVFERQKALDLLEELPPGFDFNAALTMEFLYCEYRVLWRRIPARTRQAGRSYVRWQDGIKTLTTMATHAGRHR